MEGIRVLLYTFAGSKSLTMIRKVEERDAAAIARMYNKYILETTISFEVEPLSDEAMRRRIKEISSHWPYYVWEEDGRILGYCYAHPWKERPAYANTLETTVYLAPDAKGRGIGTQLMKRLIGECKAMGVHSLIACITGDNEASIEFHKSLGFVKVSEFSQVGRKFGRWLDVVDLQLVLQ